MVRKFHGQGSRLALASWPARFVRSTSEGPKVCETNRLVKHQIGESSGLPLALVEASILVGQIPLQSSVFRATSEGHTKSAGAPASRSPSLRRASWLARFHFSLQSSGATSVFRLHFACWGHAEGTACPRWKCLMFFFIILTPSRNAVKAMSQRRS